MNLSELREKIDQKSARLAVIGPGYVGLPVAALFAEAGFDVLGVELRPDRLKRSTLASRQLRAKNPGCQICCPV